MQKEAVPLVLSKTKVMHNGEFTMLQSEVFLSVFKKKLQT